MTPTLVQETFLAVAAARTAEAGAALNDAVHRWREGLDTVLSGRIRARHGGASLEAIERAWMTGAVSADPELRLSAEERAAIVAVLETWPQPPAPRRRAWLLRHLGPLGLAVPHGPSLAMHPAGLIAMAAGLDAPGEAHVPFLGSGSPAARAGRWALLGELHEATATALAEKAPAPLSDLKDVAAAGTLAAVARALASASPDLRARLWRRWLAEPLVAPDADLLAGTSRAVILHALGVRAVDGLCLSSAQEETLAGWLGDTPVQDGPRWARSRPLVLLLDDVALLRRLASDGSGPPALLDAVLSACCRVFAAAAAAGRPDALHDIGQWLETVVPTPEAPLVAVLHALAAAGRPIDALSADAALGWCARCAKPDTRPPEIALVQDAIGWLDGPPWTEVLRLAGRPGLLAEVTSCLARPDVHGFDGAGEGRLPALWARALRVHRAQPPDWQALADVVEAAGGDREEWEELGELPMAELLDPLASPRTASELRRQADLSPMSSYAHGLNDGIAEAYGDTWAPADPFSTRAGGN